MPQTSIKSGKLTNGTATESDEWEWPGGPGSYDVGGGTLADFDGGTARLQFKRQTDTAEPADVWKDLDATMVWTAEAHNNFSFMACRMRMISAGHGASLNLPFRVARDWW